MNNKWVVALLLFMVTLPCVWLIGELVFGHSLNPGGVVGTAIIPALYLIKSPGKNGHNPKPDL